MSASASTPLRVDPGVAQQSEELAAAAADVEHRGGVAEVVHVRALALADVGGRAAHLRLEGEVVGERRPRRAGRRPSPGRRAAAAALGARQPLLELGQRARGLLARALAAVDLLEQPVDHLQDDVVEHPLLVRERLDVPAQERPQDLLQRVGDPALRPRPPLERPVGGHRPEPLGPVARREQRPRPCEPFAPPASSCRKRSTSAFTSTESGAFAGVFGPAVVIATF